MKKSNVLGIAFIALTLGVGAASTAVAKGHDQGVADGTPRDDTGLFSRGGAVAGHDIAGVGTASVGVCDGAFCGVADSMNSDLTYGRDVVSEQRALDIRRVYPVVGNQR